MFASSRELVILIAALAVAGFLMGCGIVVAVDRLIAAGQPVNVYAALAPAG
jgi:phosphotransferase system  glucose/maltose/N-acetylglucosamine-specific IIC component